MQVCINAGPYERMVIYTTPFEVSEEVHSEKVNHSCAASPTLHAPLYVIEYSPGGPQIPLGVIPEAHKFCRGGPWHYSALR